MFQIIFGMINKNYVNKSIIIIFGESMEKIIKKYTYFIIAVLLVISIALTACGRNGEVYEMGSAYENGFLDVASDSPFLPYIAFVYENGYMRGPDDTHFAPLKDIDIASAMALLCNLNNNLNRNNASFPDTEPWYNTYISYAKEHKIIDNSIKDYEASLTRGRFSEMIVNAVPESMLPAINKVKNGEIPDVPMDASYANAVYTLYRAGIFSGVDRMGNFKPESKIARQEVAAAIARVMASSMRNRFKITGNDKLSENAIEPKTHKEAAGNEYFSDAAFVGNSLVDGLKLFSGLTSSDYYSQTGLSVSNVKEEVLEKLGEKNYHKIYIELGINEITYETSYFKLLYGEMIDEIRRIEPDADIYIMSLLPVTQEESAQSENFNKDNIMKYNRTLRTLASEKGCYFLDVYSALVDTDGNLPTEMSWDGIHLTADGYGVWENYIRTHYE